MDTNRFRQRRDYSVPVRRQAPVLDAMGQLRPAPGSPKAVPPGPLPVAARERQDMPVLPTPVTPVAPPQPVYEQKPSPETIIDLSEPTNTNGWIDSIVESPVEPDPISLPAVDSSSEAVVEAMMPANISIQISLPKLQKPELPPLPYKRIARWGAIIAVALLVVFGGLAAAKHFIHHAPQTAATAGGYQALAAAALTKPSFAPVTPSNKPDLANVGSQGTAFDGTRDSYSFSDALNGVPLVVSQQPLPSKFASVSKAVSSAAQSIGAKQTIVAKSTLAYMATDSKSSTQTIVFSLKGLLIFIQSNFPHSVSDWKNYIDSLQ